MSNSLNIPNGIRFVSIGLHPWHIESGTLVEKFQKLQEMMQDPRVLFIGECGLDKVCSTEFDLQIRAFELQITLANEENKPLIIHCVKAHNEVTKLLRDMRNKVPVVFHGFNKKHEIATELLNAGYYLSFGQELFKERTSTVFQSIPLERIFLETDDHEASVANLYERAASLLTVSQKHLEERIASNLHTILGPEFKAV